MRKTKQKEYSYDYLCIGIQTIYFETGTFEAW